MKRLLETDWFQKEAAKTADEYYLEVVDNPFFHGKGQKLIPIVRPLDVAGSNSKEGWGFLGFSTKLFEEELKRADNKDTLIVTVQDGTVIADQHAEQFETESLEALTEQLLQQENPVESRENPFRKRNVWLPGPETP